MFAEVNSHVTQIWILVVVAGRQKFVGGVCTALARASVIGKHAGLAVRCATRDDGHPTSGRTGGGHVENTTVRGNCFLQGLS
jgi:hypothetical protein